MKFHEVRIINLDAESYGIVLRYLLMCNLCKIAVNGTCFSVLKGIKTIKTHRII